MEAVIDTHHLDVKTTFMGTTIKRTYNLTTEAVAHVRDMVGRGNLPASQDGVVELAIDHLYREVRDGDDAAAWAQAALDEAFINETRSIADELAHAEVRITE